MYTIKIYSLRLRKNQFLELSWVKLFKFLTKFLETNAKIDGIIRCIIEYILYDDIFVS
jgi:hypothetical protein